MLFQHNLSRLNIMNEEQANEQIYQLLLFAIHSESPQAVQQGIQLIKTNGNSVIIKAALELLRNELIQPLDSQTFQTTLLVLHLLYMNCGQEFEKTILKTCFLQSVSRHAGRCW